MANHGGVPNLIVKDPRGLRLPGIASPKNKFRNPQNGEPGVRKTHRVWRYQIQKWEYGAWWQHCSCHQMSLHVPTFLAGHKCKYLRSEILVIYPKLNAKLGTESLKQARGALVALGGEGGFHIYIPQAFLLQCQVLAVTQTHTIEIKNLSLQQ